MKKATAMTVAGTLAAPLVMAESAKGANERIGVGFIGTGGRCKAHIKCIEGLAGDGIAKPVAVCDVYRPRLLEASTLADNAKMYDAHEELLQNKDVDVVCVASPDAHHAQMTIDAMKAGKDVFCEKPLTHWSQFEKAKEIAEISRKTGKLVQVGTQYLADDNYPEIVRMVKEGMIGKPVHVQCSYFRRGDWGERMPIPDPSARPGPDLDWKRFLGDSPEVPYSVSRFFQWRLYWDYAGGPATDLLVHAYTPVFRILELDYPTRVMGGGGTLQYDREVPDQCNIIADYEDGPCVVMTNSLSNHVPQETCIRGTDGLISWSFQGSNTKKGFRVVPFEKGKSEIFVPWSGFGDTKKLWKNLLDCMRTRETPACPIEIALKVQAPLSMGILSHRENKVVLFDAQNRSFRMS